MTTCDQLYVNRETYFKVFNHIVNNSKVKSLLAQSNLDSIAFRFGPRIVRYGGGFQAKAVQFAASGDLPEVVLKHVLKSRAAVATETEFRAFVSQIAVVGHRDSPVCEAEMWYDVAKSLKARHPALTAELMLRA